MSKTKHGWHSVPACLNSIGAVAIGTALGVGLCAASALAADASWISTVTVDGTPGARCRTADLPRYRIEIRDGRFTATPDGSPWLGPLSFDLSRLKADGSGRVQLKRPDGVLWSFDFARGDGPRLLYVTSNNMECRYVWEPLK